MVTIASLAELASLAGDPGRAGMLAALMDGRALTAKELAQVAGITQQTASGHLGRLSKAGLLVVEKQGRHRYHRLSSPEVARMIEGLMQAAAAVAGERAARMVIGPRDQALRAARTCYDHLAGRLGVAIADAMIARGQIEISGDGGAVTDTGLAFLDEFGIGAELAEGGRGRRHRPFCRPCLDWSERRPHLAGVIGKAICARSFERDWIKHVPGTRAVEITRRGFVGFKNAFGIDAA